MEMPACFLCTEENWNNQYYAPWGNLAIFYKDFGYASGLVILGKIDSEVEALNVPGPIEATIELLK